MNGNQNQRWYCCDCSSQPAAVSISQDDLLGLCRGGLAGWCKLSREIIVERRDNRISRIISYRSNLLTCWRLRLSCKKENCQYWAAVDSLLIVIVFIKSLPGLHCLPGNRLFVVSIQKILTGLTQPTTHCPKSIQITRPEPEVLQDLLLSLQDCN